MTRPLIGVTTHSGLPANGNIPTIGSQQSYIQAIQHAGGLPVLIPVTLSDAELDELLSYLDGVLFPGGGDIDPLLFQGQPHPTVYGIEPDRDRTEIFLTRRAAELNKPFFGICRGIQIINVALGGTLYTHIADQYAGAMRHDWYADFPREHLAHTVRVEDSSRLAAILGNPSVEANSLHHQGVERVAPGLKPVAWAPDELVEAVELPGHRFGLGVQWHPENLQAHAEMRALFEAFVNSAK